MTTLDDTIRRFRSVDRATRLEALLDSARRLPPVPDRLAADRPESHRVPECQTPVLLWVEPADGIVRLYAEVPRESPTVRGFVSLLVRALDGRPAAEVAAVPDDLLDRLRLSEALGMTRTQGLSAVLQRIKRGARATAPD